MARKRKAGSESAGYHSDLSIPGYTPKTPTVAPPPSEAAKGPAGDYAGAGREYEHAVAALPAAAQAVTEAATQKASAEEHAARVAKRAETRQKRLVSKYVTHAYSRKLKKQGVPTLAVDAHIAKAKDELSKERERLLSHPAVKEANSEGKVLGAKGLQKVRKADTQLEAIKGPSGLKTSALHGTSPRSLILSPKDLTKLDKIGATPQGTVGRTQTIAKEKAHERGEPSTLEDLGYASIGIPGIGIGGDIAKLTELGASALPKILAEGGAKQLATSAGIKAAAKVASVRGAAKAIPEVAKAAPKAIKGLPDILRAGARETPAALKAGAKAAPKYAGKKTLQGGEKSLQAFSGVGALGALHQGGVNLPGGSILEGQAKAFEKDPGKVLSSTANLAPGLLVSALQLPVAAGASIATGSSKPLEGALKEQGDFFKHFAKTYGGSDVKAIEKATLEEGFLPEILAAPLAAKGLKKLSGPVRDRAATALESRRAPAMDAEGKVLTHEHGGAIKRGTQRVPPRASANMAVPPNFKVESQHDGYALKVNKGSSGGGWSTVGVFDSPESAAHATKLSPKEFYEWAQEHEVNTGNRLARMGGGKKQPLTRLGEHNVHRREEAFHAATMNDLIHLETAKRRSEVDKYARKAAGEKTVVREGLGKKGKDTLHQRPPDYLPFLARAGVDLHNPESALREIQHYAKQFKGLDHPAKYGVNPEALTARDAVTFFTQHPEALKDKNLAKALDAFRESQNGDTGLRSLGYSKRNQYLAPAVMHDIPLPEERVPVAARAHTDATTREGAWKDLATRDKQIKALRSEGRKKYDQAQEASPERAAKLRAEAKDAYDRARVIHKGRRELHDELKDFTRPGAKANPNAKRMAYDKALEDEFAAETQKLLKERGLHPEPAYVPDQAAISRAAPDQSATGGQKPLPGAPKINEGFVWKNGLSRQGYEHLMNEGILRQVARNHQFEDWRRFRADRGIQFEGDYQHTGKDWARAFNQGVISRKDVTLVPTQVVNRLEKKTQGGDPTEYEQALAEAQAARKLSPDDAQSGTIYEAFPKAAYEEKVAQVQRTPIAPALRHANTITSKAMLSTPAYVAAQLVSETAQAVAEGNPIRLAQGLHNYNKLTPEQKLRISGASGETAKAIFSPEDLQTTLGSYDEKPFTDALSFFRRNVFGRTAKSVVTQKWAGELNRATGSVTRRAVMTGEIMRDVHGFNAKARRLLHVQTAVQKELRGKKDPIAYVAEHPKLLDHYQKSLHDAMGGWSNLTRTGRIPENYRAAALVFYPFLRMSIQWPLKYAQRHPIKATALAYLTAQNNFALREALHGEPSFLNYAQIPVYGVGKNGQPAIINLSRVAPGGNALVTAIQGSGSALGVLQPVIAAGVMGATGQGPLGPVEGGVGAHIKASVASILGLSPYLRAADTLAGQKASGQSDFGILGKRANIALEPLAALSAKLKGAKSTQLERSLGFPFIPYDIKHQRDYAKLGRILTTLGENSSSAQAKLQSSGSAQSQRETRAKVQAMQKKSAKAGSELEALYAKYGLSKVDARSTEVYEYTHPFPETEKSGPYEGSGYGGSGYEGSGYGGGGSKEKPIPVPNKTDGIGFKLPGLSGIVGDIASPLATLIGGEKASAAELPKGGNSKAKVKVPRIEGVNTPGEATEFAQYLSKYTGLDPQFVGAWVKSEGGGTANGGEAGKNNWLGVGYPGKPTAFSQSAYFNGDAQQAAKATAQWMKGKIGHEYGYGAAPGIQAIIPAARGRGPQAALNALAASGWGTDVASVAQNLTGVSAQGKTLADAHQSGGKVYVRADAKGMVNWAHSLLGTQEGSPKQIRWAAESGVSPEEPWCSEFIAAGLARRGLPKPSNPAYSGTWLTWKGGQHIGTNLAKAKPGDVVVFGSNPGSTTHVGLYVGSGKMISGNWSNEVAAANVSEDSEPIAGIIRPKYKGGKVAVKAGTPLPGSIIAPSGELVSAPAGVPSETSTTSEKAKERKQKRSAGPTASQRLALINQISEGNLTKLGIPGYTPKVGPSVSDLAAIASELETQRQKLARL